ncbi:DUF2807 domain-containing protein [Pedobacter sp. ISL-68]|uniref:GIN domain-containing protein n=1 Tax=unclassified Pedobacter TaxID=2628915 RepID=UPI001BE728A0|nr:MULTISPECIES: DUF2807 domain-containing protein [unclassified Pedobacter]MBT2560105.1 DUF2807 domain-containing protein [Pedobacter sp. ISL-64]MBT2589084.1 DUF2807 domain-containing protein [Pedobacter sp. ISL-68]
MKIKSIVKSILFCLFTAVAVSCGKERITVSGNQITEIRTTGPFKSVNVAGASPVFISHGNDFKVELKGSDNLIAKFETKVVGDELLLKYRDVNVNNDDIHIYITMPGLTSVKTNGASSYEISGDFADQEKFTAYTYGAGNITFSGTLKANKVEAEIEGSGNLNIEKILVKNAEFKISGSGNITTSVTDKLNAQISGSGNVYYFGNPHLTTAYSGSGRVIKK